MSILAQSLPLSALPSCGGDAIGFTVGEAADYEFQLVSRANAFDTSGYFVDWDHDAYGRKIAETVYDDGAEVSAQTRYVWDGWRLLAEIDGLTGKQLANYVHGPAYIDDLVASFRDLDDDGTFDDANEHRYHLTDHQHSTIALLSPSGNVLERYTYDAFGVPSIHDPSGTQIATTAIRNHHLYTGREWLPGPGLYDLRNRTTTPPTAASSPTTPSASTPTPPTSATRIRMRGTTSARSWIRLGRSVGELRAISPMLALTRPRRWWRSLRILWRSHFLTRYCGG